MESTCMESVVSHNTKKQGRPSKISDYGTRRVICYMYLTRYRLSEIEKTTGVAKRTFCKFLKSCTFDEIINMFREEYNLRVSEGDAVLLPNLLSDE